MRLFVQVAVSSPFFKKGGEDPSFLPSFKYAIFSLPADIKRVSTASTQDSTQSTPPPYNTMCLGDDEFINTSSMTYDDIKKFLKDKGSFLKEDDVMDVNGVFFDPAAIIDFAAQTYGVNPQVLLTTLDKEQGAVKANDRLEDKKLKHIMGYGSPSTMVDQILDAAAQFRRDFDRLSSGQTTLSGWKVGVTIQSGEPNPGDEKDASGNSISVTPANKAVAILFTYTPWVGEGWGGKSLIGGNALFCQLWDEFGFTEEGPLPDLILTNTLFFPPNPPFSGSFFWDIVNQGEATAKNFLIHFFLVNTSSGTEQLFCCSFLMSLDPGDSIGFANSISFCGSCFLRIVVDPTNDVRESNEENNTVMSSTF